MKEKIVRLAWLAMILLGAFWAGTWFPPQPAATAEVRKSAPREHFLAGGERAVPILQEIANTLKQIDARLSRIEEIAAATAKR